ncbi:MAG: GNAT family protein [Aquihabitans sp.]
MADLLPGSTHSLIRPATADDVPSLVAIREAVAGEERWIGLELPIDHAREAAILRDGIANPHNVWLVVEVDGLLVGYGGIHDDDHGHGDVFMALLGGHRGRGFGGRLLGEALASARSSGRFHKILLAVWPHNVAALALYRKFGFIVEGYRHSHWRRASGELWDVVLMGLLLEA